MEEVAGGWWLVVDASSLNQPKQLIDLREKERVDLRRAESE